MTFLRLIRRSFQNRIPKLGSDGSHHYTILQQQKHRGGLIHSKALLIPTSSTLHSNRQQFYSTTTATDQHDETALSSETLQHSTNNDISSKENDRWEGATSIINTTERTTDDIWEEYTRLLEDPAIELKGPDYIAVCTALKTNTTSTTSIKRIQTLLRHIHERGDMPKVFVRCCNMLIYLFLEHRDLNSARLVFDGLLRSKYKPTSVTVRTLINGIGKLGTAKDLLALYHSLSQQGLFPNTIDTYKSLIRVLGNDFDDVNTSVAIFTMLQENNNKHPTSKNNKLPTPDIHLHNIMLTIYKYANQRERAWDFYCKTIMAEDSGVTPNLGTYYALLSDVQPMDDNDIKKARIKTIYDDMKRLGVDITASHYVFMGYDALDILNILKRDGPPLTTYDYNTLLLCAVKNNKFDDALTMFKEMSKDGGDDTHNKSNDNNNSEQKQSQMISPDVFTYGIIMDALAKDIEQPADVIFDVYKDMKQHGIAPDTPIFGCLLQVCGRDGDTNRAVDILDEMQQYKIKPNLSILNSFLGILSRKQDKKKNDMYIARAILDQMTDMGVYPDTRTFNQYLSLLFHFVPTVDSNEIKSSLSRMQPNDNQQASLDDLFDDDDNNNSNESTTGMPMSSTAKYMMKVYRMMRHSKNTTNRPDAFTYSILINTMVAQRQTRQAMLLFRDAQLFKKTVAVHVYNTIMQGLLRNNELHQVMHMWQDMKANHVLPTWQSYDLVLDTCEQLHLVESFTTIMRQRELDSGRLTRLDEAREKRWSRSKSIQGQQQQQQQLDDGRDQHGVLS